MDRFIEASRIAPGSLEHLYPEIKGATAGRHVTPDGPARHRGLTARWPTACSAASWPATSRPTSSGPTSTRWPSGTSTPRRPSTCWWCPTRHIVNASTVDAEDAEDVAALLVAAKAVADAEGIGGEDRGYRLVFNVGPDALNSVPHLHLHVLGGRTFDWPPG